ncbi:MAG TPA: hypothetical protein VJ123_07455 [Anaerolineales bacterium]|nr:hypothetical protein [Anaerolineales bacterium]
MLILLAPATDDRSPCQVTLGGGASWRRTPHAVCGDKRLGVAPSTPPLVQPSPRRRSSAVGAAKAEPSLPQASDGPLTARVACAPVPAWGAEPPGDGRSEAPVPANGLAKDPPPAAGRSPEEPAHCDAPLTVPGGAGGAFQMP